jgi:hypothetical protein
MSRGISISLSKYSHFYLHFLDRQDSPGGGKYQMYSFPEEKKNQWLTTVSFYSLFYFNDDIVGCVYVVFFLQKGTSSKITPG